eukprot:4191247-Pyramimonas_sp.AAC.1
MQQHITASMSAAMAHVQQELVSTMQVQLAPTVARLTAVEADARRQQDRAEAFEAQHQQLRRQ